MIVSYLSPCLDFFILDTYAVVECRTPLLLVDRGFRKSTVVNIASITRRGNSESLHPGLPHVSDETESPPQSLL